MTTRLKILKSDQLDDWYLIERAEHDGREWMEPTEHGARFYCSSRFSDADIEGTAGEMLGIAHAIEGRSHFTAKRCAVAVRCASRVEFWSPRNSTECGTTSRKMADLLAKEIRGLLNAPRREVVP